MQLSRFILTCCFALFFIIPNCFAEPIQLADNGMTDYIITIPENAAAVQRTAGLELAKYLYDITGADFPVREETAETISPNVKQFAVGPSKTTDMLLKTIGESERTDYAYDAVKIAQCGESVVLTGHSVRGMLYAVYTFLENDLGCRWWTASESVIPRGEAPVIEVTPVDYAPKLQYRESYYTGFNGPDRADFALKMKCNGNHNAIPQEFGGHQAFTSFGHSFYQLIPPEKYFHDHPDWFPEIDGVRQVGRIGAGFDEEFRKLLGPGQLASGGTQLCLTNEGLFQEMLKNALDLLKSRPDATVLSISQNDSFGWCTCEKCRAVDEEEGSQSGTLIRFVNRMAEEIEKVYPNVYVDTFAYQYTRKPPKITHARHNVIVRLCSIECSFAQPLKDGGQNASFVKDIEKWSEMAPNLFVWDYVTDFALYLLPFPNYHVWQDNINFFIDHHAIGLFEQGDYHLLTGDFVQLRGWVMAKLLWDPSQDQRKLMEEFIAGYYAPELVPVYTAYFNTLSEACKKSGIHLGFDQRNVTGWLDLDSLNRATELQDEALAAAERLAEEDPAVYASLPEKVLRERIPLDLVWAMNHKGYKKESLLFGKDYKGPENPLTAAQELFARYEKCGLKKYNESEGEEGYEDFKQNIFAGCREDGPQNIPDELKGIPENRLFVYNNDMFRLAGIGRFTFRENDAAADGRNAVRMPNTHHEWAVSVMPDDMVRLIRQQSDSPVKFRVYAEMRADHGPNAADEAGEAGEADAGSMTMGIYDQVSRQIPIHTEVSMAQIEGTEYKLIELGTYEPGQAGYFWAAPVMRGDESSVWISRLFFVWENE